jgi:hypothetical protein
MQKRLADYTSQRPLLHALLYPLLHVRNKESYYYILLSHPDLLHNTNIYYM